MKKYCFDASAKALLESVPIPLAVYQFVDKRVVVLALSEGFCRLFGYDFEEAYFLMDHDMYRDTHPDDKARIANAAFRFATLDERYEVIYRTWTEDGYRIVHAMGEHVTLETGERLAYVWYTDEGAYAEEDTDHPIKLSQNLRNALHEESLLQASFFDYLTGLPSMSYFFELAEEWRRSLLQNGGTMALLYMDLSGMKYYNRKYGFSEGDRLLQAFADIIKKLFSNENCSRFGSDHFCVFTDAADLESKLHTVFSEMSRFNNGDSLSVRVGIYLDNSGSLAVSTLCDRAKYACDTLRKRVDSSFRYFNDDMLQKSEGTQYIITNLTRALNSGWVEVYYQPIISAQSKCVCDEEALARWIDPVHGMISPADFVPVLEDARLIYKLDLYVCDRVLQKLKDHDARGQHSVSASINLSRVDFDTCDIVEEVRRRVDDAGISRDRLTIEVTESVLASDFDYMREQIERFQRLGFRVWMDDFGSGYSSLDVLQSVRFDLIKFDMRFMKGFNTNEKSKIVLRELVKLTKALGIQTVCEGVETAEQVRFLREIGCDKLQGYYFSPPVPLPVLLERYYQTEATENSKQASSTAPTAIGSDNCVSEQTEEIRPLPVMPLPVVGG